MKNLIMLALIFVFINLSGQDDMLFKNGGSYFYKGNQYNWKELGLVYMENVEVFNIYHGGKRNLNSAKNLAIGGVVTIGVGLGTMFLWSSVYGRVYGGIAVLAGGLVEAGALFYLVKGRSKLRKARIKFNFDLLEQHGYKSDMSLAFGNTRNGFGLLAQF